MTDKEKSIGTGTAPGQQKMYTVTNPTTGESRVVTQAQWREEKLGKQGFEKPDDLDEPEPEPEPSDSGSTGGTV